MTARRRLHMLGAMSERSAITMVTVFNNGGSRAVGLPRGLG